MKSAAFICTFFMLCRIKSKLVEHQSNLSSCSSLPVRVKIKWKGIIQVWPHFVVAFCSRWLVSCECQQHLRHLTYVCIRVYIDKFCPEENLGEYEYFFCYFDGKKVNNEFKIFLVEWLLWQQQKHLYVWNELCLESTHTQQKCCSWLLSQCSMVYWLYFGSMLE